MSVLFFVGCRLIVRSYFYWGEVVVADCSVVVAGMVNGTVPSEHGIPSPPEKETVCQKGPRGSGRRGIAEIVHRDVRVC